MTEEMTTLQISVWTVEFSSKTEQRFRYNGFVTVVSVTAERALSLVRERWPDAQINALHKRSRGEMIIDPVVSLTAETTT